MGPRHGSRGKAASYRISDAICWLQWGRDMEVAESLWVRYEDAEDAAALQWGRDMEVAERLNFRKFSAQYTVASMGPRHGSRGKTACPTPDSITPYRALCEHPDRLDHPEWPTSLGPCHNSFSNRVLQLASGPRVSLTTSPLASPPTTKIAPSTGREYWVSTQLPSQDSGQQPSLNLKDTAVTYTIPE